LLHGVYLVGGERCSEQIGVAALGFVRSDAGVPVRKRQREGTSGSVAQLHLDVVDPLGMLACSDGRP
jgi:hypothetical protein